MRKLFLDTIFLLNKYYDKGGTKIIAYESALMTMTTLILIHVLQIKVLVVGGGLTMGDSRLVRLLSVSIVFIPVYFLLQGCFKKAELDEHNYSGVIRKGYSYLIIYVILSISLLVVLVLANKK